jgi:hypothetical protein
MGGDVIMVNKDAVSVGVRNGLVIQRIESAEDIPDVELAMNRVNAIQLELAIHEAVEQLGHSVTNIGMNTD